jgi:hypothetical protein
MTLERVLQATRRALAAGTQRPHCFRAHVPGQGYVNDGSILASRADYLRQLDRAVESEIANMGHASTYGEPGYTQPRHGILFANWNMFPDTLPALLEQLGYESEWSDEWTTCEDCHKAFRIQPTGYSWTPSIQFRADESADICNSCYDNQ